MRSNRRNFLQLSVSGLATALANPSLSTRGSGPKGGSRRFHFVQIDVFSTHRLQGNPLAVFPDARGLTDAEMQDIARETNLQETTFVFPRDPAIERERGVKVRIFIPDQEIPFGGHPTLGTAMVLRNRLANRKTSSVDAPSVQEISLDLQVGKIPVAF